MEDIRNELQNDLKKVGSIQDWISFNKMITPIIIKILFWLGVVISVIFGLIMIITSFKSLMGAQQFIMGLLVMVLGPISVRIYCEILFVIFGIFDELKAINAKTR